MMSSQSAAVFAAVFTVAAVLALAFHRDAELSGAPTVKGAPELGR
jgi:hypothetical protein